MISWHFLIVLISSTECDSSLKTCGSEFNVIALPEKSIILRRRAECAINLCDWTRHLVASLLLAEDRLLDTLMISGSILITGTGYNGNYTYVCWRHFPLHEYIRYIDCIFIVVLILWWTSNKIFVHLKLSIQHYLTSFTMARQYDVGNIKFYLACFGL